MTCPICGAEMPEGAAYCTTCGAQLSQLQPTNPTFEPGQQTYVQPQTGYDQQPDYSHAPTGYQQSGYNQAPAGYQQPGYGQMPTGYGAAPKPAKYKKKYNPGNFGVWIGCVLAALGTFLPYYTVSFLGMSESPISLMDTGSNSELADGVFFLIVIGLVALINIFKLNIGNIIFSAFTLFLAWYEMDYSSSQLGIYSSLVTKGAGYYLLAIGAVVMLIAAIVGLVINIKRKVDFKRGY